MAPHLTVTDQLFERMYIKTVVSSAGVQTVPPGLLPGPTDNVLALMGEPAFQISFTEAVVADQDVTDDVGFALRRAAERFKHLEESGLEVTESPGHVEWTIGPALYEGPSSSTSTRTARVPGALKTASSSVSSRFCPSS